MFSIRLTPFAVMLWTLMFTPVIGAEIPAPTFDAVFPPGGAAGTSIEVVLTGTALSKVQTLTSNLPNCQCEMIDALRARVTIPADTLPGSYELWAVCDNRITAPRRFFVSQRTELLEVSPNDSWESAQKVPLSGVINGRIEQPGDVDWFAFDARRGQRIVIDCSAERLDSRLRAVLEVFDAQGRRLAVNRGYFGIDPLIDFSTPADGRYTVKLHDLISTGGNEHLYRLDVDAGPRVAFTVPNVVPRGQNSRVTVYGWNLSPSTTPPATSAVPFDHVEVDIPAAMAQETWPLPVGLSPAQVTLVGFPYHFPSSQAAVIVGVTDLPLELEQADHHSPAAAQPIACPVEISGRLIAGDERDWFAFDAVRGEVLHFDVLSQRIGAPTDLQLVLFDSRGELPLATWNDQVANPGGSTLAVNHLDPGGRWVVPADGRYLLLIRNLIGGAEADPRRSYRLQVQRETPDMHLVVVPPAAVPRGFHLQRGGRTAVEILAIRQRGLQDSIRISAVDLPFGVECPDIALGPGVDRGWLVFTADSSVAEQVLSLKMMGAAATVGTRPVRGSTVIRAGLAQGGSRLTSDSPMAIAGESPVRVTAAIPDTLNHQLYGKLRPRFSPGSVLDVIVTLEHGQPQHRPAARLTGIGVPSVMSRPTAEIAAGHRTAALSFYLPPTMPLGEYSLAISAETTVPTADGKTEPVTIVSNAITFTVEPAAFVVEVDPFAPRRLKRGSTVQLAYSAARCNGFIGKIHTELASPGVVTDVPGLRGRGVTFTGSTDQATIQIVVNDDAPLGPQPFLRLLAVGVVEDQAIYQGAAFYPVEIVE